MVHVRSYTQSSIGFCTVQVRSHTLLLYCFRYLVRHPLINIGHITIDSMSQHGVTCDAHTHGRRSLLTQFAICQQFIYGYSPYRPEGQLSLRQMPQSFFYGLGPTFIVIIIIAHAVSATQHTRTLTETITLLVQYITAIYNRQVLQVVQPLEDQLSQNSFSHQQSVQTRVSLERRY